jgi:hypothetical protein
MPDQPPLDAAFRVPRWLDALGGLISRHPRACIGLGNLETRVLADEIAAQRIEQPIYVCGLARAGSTILLELLACHADTASHAYKDFPALFTPYFWNGFRDRAGAGAAAPVERAHGDGMRVTPDSPEALEEMLWLAFFPASHQAQASAVLDGATAAPEFERFYRNHLRKMLWLRGGRRYLAKGNYHATRLPYLLHLFPDARFVVPVRAPAAHIGSLLRQHQRFSALHRADPRALRYMQRAGHFEFGLDRRPINAGDDDATRRIAAAWRDGAEIEGWARLWSAVYACVARALDASPPLRAATLIVRYEDLCAAPQAQLQALFAHCRLPVDAAFIAAAAQRLRFADYYQPPLNAADIAVVDTHTRAVAERFGYGAAAAAPAASRRE